MALVLTRKLNERIQIGKDITVAVSKIKGNRVTLAIEAPKEVEIIRPDAPTQRDACDEGSGK